MTCEEAQALITPFINRELDLKTMELFIPHIRSCEDCREELEVYYALLTAMRDLDEDKSLSGNYPEDLNRQLAEIENRIRLRRVLYRRRRVLLFLLLVLWGVLLGIGYAP